MSKFQKIISNLDKKPTRQIIPNEANPMPPMRRLPRKNKALNFLQFNSFRNGDSVGKLQYNNIPNNQKVAGLEFNTNNIISLPKKRALKVGDVLRLGDGSLAVVSERFGRVYLRRLPQ